MLNWGEKVERTGRLLAEVVRRQRFVHTMVEASSSQPEKYDALDVEQWNERKVVLAKVKSRLERTWARLIAEA